MPVLCPRCSPYMLAMSSALGRRAMAYCLVGAGGVIGGLLMPQVRRHMSRDQTLSCSAIIYAGATAILAAINVAWVAYGAMCLAGLAWVLGMTSLNVTAQVVVPEWVKARALASYQLIVQGSIAIGGLLWGGAASHSSIRVALDIAAVLLVAGLVVSALPAIRIRNLCHRTT